MRNLKRALSLTLASVMLLGMMVVGSSAAGYPDVDAEDNVEAIEVIQAIGVMVGDENGNFRPDSYVSRAEMAVVIAKLLNLDYDYYVTSCPFSDVSGIYDWARGSVGACYANKYLSGRSETVFDPGATVTAVEASSMLMRVLGYFQYANDVADGFELSTVRQGTNIGIYNGVGSNATEPMTRNQVAQLVLNALKSGTVQPDGNTTTFLNPDGSVLATTGKVNYVYTTSLDQTYATAISSLGASSIGSTNDGWIVELGEQLYNGKLRLYDPTDDDFMRPSRTWEYDGKEIGTYMKVENIRETYTAGVTNRTLYDLLGRTILQEYDFNYYVDGVLKEDTANTVLNRQDRTYGKTGRGVLTQVFVDIERRTIDITSINTYLAQATTDYNKTTESVSLSVYCGADQTGSSPNVVTNTRSTTKPVSVTDVPAIETLTQDDYVLVNVSGKNGTSPNESSLQGYDVVAVSDVEILTDSSLTKFSKRGSDSDTASDQNQALFASVVSGGTEYKSSAKAYYSDDVLELYDDGRLVNKTYNIYLDPYGYAIGIDLYEGDSNYVFITGFDPSGSNIAYGNAKAAAIFVDGTTDVITVDTKATNTNIAKVDGYSDNAGTTRLPATDANYNSYFEQWKNGMEADKYAINRWYTYTVNASGVYTLHPATRMITTEVTDDPAVTTDGLTIKTNSVRIDEKASYADDTMTGGTPDWDGKNATAAGSDDVRTYGDDNSVYIVVELGDTDTVDNSGANKVITGVSGVYTGVQSVEIEVTGNTSANIAAKKPITDTALYDSIYTLYDKNNHIIASVILGQAKGGNTNYAYILTSAKSEELVDSDGSVIWEFDAIVDGKVETLKTSDKFSVISGLEPGHIQELRYTAGGEYVSSVKTPEDGAKYYDYNEAITRRIDKEEIYDVGHAFAANSDYDCVTNSHPDTVLGGGATYITTTPNPAGHLTQTQAPDLKIEGNTMYFKRTGSDADYGLAIENTRNTPAVVIHQVDGSWDTIECATVAQAISELGDPNATSREKEFEGRIVAVLNSQGAAKWVVFISYTPKNTASGGSVSSTSVECEATTRVAEVQELLNNRRNVKINGNWRPSDADLGDNVRLEIPAGTTLTIDGNFIADDGTNGNRVRISGEGTLVVNGRFETSSDVSSTISYTVKANSMVIHDGSGNSALTIDNNVTVSDGNLTINGSGTHSITINAGVTVDIDGSLVNRTAARTIHVNGTLKTTSHLEQDSGTLTVNVNSTYSLHVGGSVKTGVTVNVGQTAAGRAVINEVGGGTVNVKNTGSSNTTITTVTTGTVTVETNAEAAITTVAGGTVEAKTGGEVTVSTVTGGTVEAEANSEATVTTVTGGTVTADGTGSVVTVDTVKNTATVQTDNGGSATVGVAESGSTLKTQNANDTLTITGTLDTRNIVAKQGSDVILGANTVLGSNAPAITGPSGETIETVGGEGLTIDTTSDINNASGGITATETPEGTLVENTFMDPVGSATEWDSAPYKSLFPNAKNVISYGVEQEFTAATEGNIGVLKLTGKVVNLKDSANSSKLTDAVVGEFCALSTVNDFITTYELEDVKGYGFIYVAEATTQNVKLILVVDYGEGYEILIRNDRGPNADNKIEHTKLHNQQFAGNDLTKTFGLDVSGLS